MVRHAVTEFRKESSMDSQPRKGAVPAVPMVIAASFDSKRAGRPRPVIGSRLD
jgi:hypothetical protein